MKLTKVHLLALAFVAGVLPAVAYADGWFSRAGEKKEVTLNDLLKNPREYLDVEVEFKVYFDATGRNFNPFFTRFNEEVWGNFSAWPIDARLYDKRDYPRPYPFFFASKMNKAWKKVKDVEHLRVIEITGVVRDVFKGQPWIEVLSWGGASGGLSDDDIRDVVNADANYVAGHYEDAARLYDRADSSSLPDSVRADLLRRLGDANFRAGDFGDAQDAYEQGLRCAPDNAVLKQGAAASELARQQAKASRRGETVAGVTPEIAPGSQPAVQNNGTDEVIRLLEDPATVQAEVDAWRLELEHRAAALGAARPSATAVAGTEEPAAEATPEPAPEVTETPAVEEKVVPTEGCGDTEATDEACAGTTDEACAEQPAEEVTEQPAEEPAVAEPVEAAEPVVETPEQPEGTPEGAAAGTETVVEEESATGTGEGACGGAGTATEGCAEAVDTAEGESSSGTDEACGCESTWSEGCAEEACGSGDSEQGETAPDGTVALPGDERVVWVSGQMVRLPRLPFFGCEDVTDDDLRAIIEEVVQNPESDE